MYCTQMGYKLFTGRTVCKKVQKPSGESGSQSLFVRSNEGSAIPESELRQLKVALKMQGGAYMFINRLGSYHKNLSLDTFFKIKLTKIVENTNSTALGGVPHVFDYEEIRTQDEGFEAVNSTHQLGTGAQQAALTVTSTHAANAKTYH